MFKGDIPIRLLSKDQDLLQLIDDNVKVWLSTSKSKAMFKELGIDSTTLNIPDGVFEFDEDKFRHFYNFNSCQMVDFKALAGDNSDNIPGVKGLGERSIVPILNKFKGINDLYNFLDTAEKEDLAAALLSLKDKGLKQNPFPKLLKAEKDGMMSAKDLAFLSYKLALIKCDIPELNAVKLNDLILSIDETKEKKVLEKYEIRSLI